MKKNFSLKFMAMAMAAALVAAPGCKDYDDDINNLREQTAGIKKDLDKAKGDLTAAIKDVEAKAAAAQKAADEAKEAAKKALQDALAADAKLKAELEALADKAQKAAEAAQKTADDAHKKADQLRKDLEALVKRVEALERNSATKEELAKAKEELLKEIEKVMKRVEEFVGNRVTSIALVPTYHINGIAAAELLGVAYKAQAHVDHLPFGFATKDKGNGDKVFMPSQGEFIFKLSPSRVSEASFTQPSFETWVSKNRLRVEAGETGVDKPFKPMGYTLEGNKLTVTVVKTVNSSLNQSEHWFNEFTSDPWCETGTDQNEVEKFYMGALTLPIAEKYWTSEEAAATEKPAVVSEGFRVDEVYVAPVIKSRIAKGQEVGYITMNGAAPSAVTATHHNKCASEYKPYAYDNTPSDRHYWDADKNGKKDAGELAWGLPTHFSDSTLLYNSKENQLIDLDLEWDQTYDLMDYVAVATKASHDDFDYKKHGLGFHFAVAKGKYLQGTNQTDQQEFAKLEGSVLTNKVYSIGGASETAIGREPIIRVTLYDLESKAVVDQRYMKVKWIKTAKIKHIGTSTFEDFYVNCKGDFLRLNTQKMNEDIYRQAEEKHGIAKTTFTDRYTRLEIISLTKNGEYIVQDGKFTADYAGATMSTREETGKPHPWKNLQLYYVPEGAESTATDVLPPEQNAGNTSFNIVWTLQPEIIRSIVETGKAEFILKFKFYDRLKELHLTHDFKVVVKLPEQNFNYEETYWSDGKMGQEFKVNPLVYTPVSATGDKTRVSDQTHYDNVDYNDGYFVHGHTPYDIVGDSHIQTDLVNGFIYKGKKVANVNQLIQYIRECAKVRFAFDESRFGEFKHLKGYVVSDKATRLWKDAAPATDPANKDFIQTDENYAASILNFLSVKADTNEDKNLSLPYSYPENIVNDNVHGAVDEARALIRLHETNTEATDGASDLGTPAAINLVGKVVPVMIVAEYNQWNQVPVKRYDVKFIEPLKVKGQSLGYLVDAQIGGSFTGKLSDKYTFTDWNKQPVADNSKSYDKELWKYYAVKTLVFNVKEAKTNIKNIDGNNIVTDEDYRDGNLPSGRILQQVKVTNTASKPYEFTEVQENPTHLRYHNNSGTPVNKEYKIFLDVTARYKWGVIKSPQEILVKVAPGTPDDN
ncbi:hypothetical protein [Porphyromonas sp.]|uniref:hypothetical protein n=1 Tax=Porphyromonas sp. TaxID=1924944 RepID=UPI0026DBF544|nr:hypothetical protein [Porphyromonas sp.]MDO4771397.1 hypothetical protein [Porphyromonas sp.]